MSGTQTGGFDVVYQISRDRFLAVLRNLFLYEVPLRLLSVPISFGLPGTIPNLTQTGTISMPNQPSAMSIDFVAGSPDAFNVTLTLPNAILSLNAVPAGGLFPGLGGLVPTNAGNATLTLFLSITTARVGSSSPITISSRSAPTLSDLPLPDTINLPAGATLDQMKNAIRAAIRNAAVPLIQGMLPRTVPIALPTSGPCSIFPQSLAVKLLPGTVPSLAFMLTLRSGMAGNPGLLTASNIPAGQEGTLLLANSMLRQLLCCVLPTQIAGINVPDAAAAGAVCCTWGRRFNVTLGGVFFPEAQNLRLCVGNGITFTGSLIQRGTGWWARATFTLAVTLRAQDNTIVPVSGHPNVTLETGLEWWVWLIAALLVVIFGIVGAVVGALLGGWGGGIAGAAIGVFVGAAIAAALIIPLYGAASLVGSVVGNALTTAWSTFSALTILPADLTATFGRLQLVGDPILDDALIRGRVAVPERRAALAEASDQVLLVGQQLDFSRGSVIGSTLDEVEG
ncbi:MAG TPA: hypothetical protein VG106_06415, partial [Vicinamibacterales bacterium]|nr:hypothetical protein [Vicinamibacterales bacterium]